GHIGGGLTRFNGSVFEEIKMPKIKHDVTGIIEDEKGVLWISSVGDGVLTISNPWATEVATLKPEPFTGKESLSAYVYAVYKRKNNDLLFVTDLGLKIFNRSTQRFDFLKLKNVPTYFQIICVFEDSKSNLWLGTHEGGIYQCNDEQGLIKIYDVVKDGLAFNFISVISEDHKGNIWVGTWGGGISVINNGKIVDNFNNKNGLYDNMIRAITPDLEGNILVGTNEHGLMLYKGKRFIAHTTANGLINNQVWAITKDNFDRIWFGTNEGITLYSTKTKDYQSFSKENSRLISTQIRFLVKDKSGNIWIGTNDAGIQLYNVSQSEFEYPSDINNSFPRSNTAVTALEVDQNNNLWFGTTEWLVRYQFRTKKITSYSTGDGLTGNEISSIYCDNNNVLWVGCARNGLSKIIKGKVTAVDLDERFTAKCMVQDLDGQLWVGTEARGILILKDGKIIKQYKTSDGLLSNNILTLSVDVENNVFIGTSAGLNQFNSTTKIFHAYKEKSGFTGLEVKGRAAYRDEAGDMWFGTINGAFKYSKDFDHHNTREPFIFINRFRVNLKDRAMEENLRLQYNDRSVTFDFGSICLSDAQAVIYQYKLVGADKNWISAEENIHTVTYSPLRHGSYTFMVKARNNEGIWNEKPVTYSFTITPPFWATWWFYSLLALATIASIWLYIKIRERNHVREKRILEETVVIRTNEVVKEKEKSEALLLNTLPAKVVDELKKYGKTEPESFENVTVFFSDICSFTDISAKLDLHLTISELNHLFTAFDDIMIKHDCERIKTFGDGYMAVCGLPEENPHHARNIARAALDIQEYLEERPATHNIKWRVRMGINSGKVTGGVVGVRKYLYDIFGDTVNTASRMETNSEPMKINCSESTHTLLKNSFEFTPRETMHVKGKGDMKMYFINGERVTQAD
ncbi:MAG: ligand-binding sensor domain-containing protein/class 3 adenylate cyclase, partial [Bacteroidia bacterium]